MTENGERFAPGEKVYLLREVRAGRRIHERGTRAWATGFTRSELAHM